ncbi:Protein farnesyltransferase subunit beta [Parasponia andersonii]|uniref:Protein farnesyltransferase subunit beta n=1 Tax=Parasponia andersonii TaxID=3476 RepID=A0A2P5AJC5_PARAD|nr:Protein farnesyltransferase subunit beta [Parasponia andersonii]
MESETQVVPTVTEREQWMVENDVFHVYDLFANAPRNVKPQLLKLRREKHLEYLNGGLRYLGPSFCVLDANRPWLCYWILHSLALLGEPLDAGLESKTIDFLGRCQDQEGGYGGGPGQASKISKLYTFLLQMKHPSGGFRMHDGGEIDVRACYTAISVASILNILDDELVHNVGNYILSCQTYEGGIAGEPSSEAHGGYTFCGLATMILINEVNRLDLTRLIDWLVFRQGRECGFQGRTNKLVDGCYSFWQGGSFALLRRVGSLIDAQLVMPDAGEHCTVSGTPKQGEILEGTSSQVDKTSQFRQGGLNGSCRVNYNDIGHSFISTCPLLEPLFNSSALQQYILLCSQVQEGGLRDKPGKSRDYYHTCYCLSGLSVCQYYQSEDDEALPSRSAVLGPYSNQLEPVHPLFNVVLKQYYEAHEFFRRQ